MSDITVRKVKFEFPDDLGEVFPGRNPAEEAFQVGFSLTLPLLEPYLIRTYRTALEEIRDEELAEDVHAFIGQEAQHHRNHHRANVMIKSQLDPVVSDRLTAIEDALAADYKRFSASKSLRFNLVYAEGFEAMTCAIALTGFEVAAQKGRGPAESTRDGGGGGGFGPWQHLWAWHAAEEIEHRTVAFRVYEHLVGSYPYRAAGSAWAQSHFLRYTDRFQRVLLKSQGHSAPPRIPGGIRRGPKRYARTFLPGYDPADIEPGPIVDLVLAMTPTAD